nr:MAG TPA: hypothetical protein [Caudoviricetes sp.]
MLSEYKGTHFFDICKLKSKIFCIVTLKSLV